MKRALINLTSIIVTSCLIAGCAVTKPAPTQTEPVTSAIVISTTETTEATTTTEASGHFEFKPIVMSSIFREIMGEDMYKAYCNYVTAVQNGEDDFEVKDEHTYDWMMGQFPYRCFPVLDEVIEPTYNGGSDVKDGTASFRWKIPEAEARQKIDEFIVLTESILNEALEDDYTDLEKALALGNMITKMQNKL